MITMQQARERLSVRLDRLEPSTRESDRTAPIEAMAMLCIGSDVHGPELEQEIKESTGDLVARLETGACDCTPEPPELNCSSLSVIAGALTRSFWLGYAYGEAAE